MSHFYSVNRGPAKSVADASKLHREGGAIVCVLDGPSESDNLLFVGRVLHKRRKVGFLELSDHSRYDYKTHCIGGKRRWLFHASEGLLRRWQAHLDSTAIANWLGSEKEGPDALVALVLRISKAGIRACLPTMTPDELRALSALLGLRSEWR